MSVLLVVVALLVLVAVAIAASDQLIARQAERIAAQYLTAPLGGPASLRVHGEPFLTQALRGRYRDVEVDGRELRLGEIAGAHLRARLRNVYLPLRAVLSGGVAELPVEHLSGTVVVPYGELARLSRLPTLLLTHDGTRLLASVAVPIPGISSLARVSGEALLNVSDEGGVWLRMRGLAVAGVTVPSIVLNQLLPSLSVPIPLPPLPYGLRIHDLTPTVAGLEVHGAADAVVFRRPAPAG
jgi:hypothetical protein